jgi:hypothetical protein
MGSLEEARAEAAEIMRLQSTYTIGGVARRIRAFKNASDRLGMQLRAFGARDADELDRAFVAMVGKSVDGLLVLAEPILAHHHKRIVEFAAKTGFLRFMASKEFAADSGIRIHRDIACCVATRCGGQR